MAEPRAALAVLRTRADFLAVAASQRKWATPGLVLQCRPWADGPPGHPAGPDRPSGAPIQTMRVGFTASKKVGNAVARNRAKRRLRALAAELLPDHGRPGHDYVLIGRAETPHRPFALLRADLTTALDKVSRSRPRAAAR